ncbi:head GIN domain-containing protein [Aquimarina agarivorans]|uniref:head GIN domain-containing protein n=1 Tax=Aquimarina agarivorans TaxID=980584 RepID=UPI000248FD31|nr:head GIN domain-containing protein [Aquimarina agarivorans]
MKTIFIKTKLILILLFCSSQLQAQWWWGSKKVVGNGNITTKTVTTADYSSIRLQGSMDVHLEQGTEGKIRVTTDDNVHEYLKIKVEGDKLILAFKDNINLRTRKGIHIYVPFMDISAVSITGSGDIDANTIIKTSSLKASVTGSGNIKLAVEASSVKSQITGSGNVELKGSTQELEVGITGSGDFNSKDLKADNTEVTISGSGDAKVVALERLTTKVSGSGDIMYAGNPKNVNSKTSGSGSVSSFEN